MVSRYPWSLDLDSLDNLDATIVQNVQLRQLQKPGNPWLREAFVSVKSIDRDSGNLVATATTFASRG